MKRILFALITIALFFILGELILRWSGYGGDYPLFVKRELAGKEKWQVNRDVAQRYFDLEKEMVPEASEELFDVKRKENSLRVVCIGGSTTAGYPFEVNATFPFQLQFRLRNALLDHYVEVINLGIAAINSFTVRDLMPEIVQADPDVIIIYMGHNEFYGAFGAASSISFTQNATLIRAHFALKRFRLYQLLDDALGGLAGLFSPMPEDASLMQTLAADRTIYENSATFRTATSNFEDNLQAIIREAKANGITVVVSTLVSNLADQPPFISAPFSSDEAEERFSATLEQQKLGRDSSALSAFNSLLASDSLVAKVHYRRGQLLQAMGDSSAAFEAFLDAKENDLLRFRAPELFNAIIHYVAEKQNVPLAEMREVFRASSHGGLPGKQLFLEHLHPTFDGYRLMAQTYFEVLRRLQVIDPPKPIVYDPDLLGSSNIADIVRAYRKTRGSATPLDIEFGKLRAQVLTNRWPFVDEADAFTMTPSKNVDAQTANLAYRHVKGEISWSEAHYALAEYYIAQKQFDKAFDELRAVNLAYYDNFVPHLKLGDLSLLREKFNDAARWYRNALDRDPKNANVMVKLGQSYVFGRQYNEATKYLALAISRDMKTKEFSDFQKANIYYLQGVSYANLKRWQDAQSAIDKALAADPTLAPAQKLRRQIEEYRSQNETK